jgi:hypothetical protein
MGKTGCFRANAAYALYGIARDDAFSDSENACGKKHYINSFFTNYGAWSFINALGLNSDAYGLSFECKLEGDGEKSDYDKTNAPIYPNSTSYTTACTKAGTLMQARFKGAYCNGQNFAEVIDTMDDMNAAIANNTSDACLKIYSNPDSNVNSINSINITNVTNSTDYGYDAVDNDEDSIASVYSLFFYSVACNFYEYPDRCPDPYGFKRDIDSAMLPKPMGWAAKVNFLHWTKLLIYIFIVGGTLLKVRTSIIDGTVEDMLKRRKRRMEQLERQGRTPKDTIESQVREAGEFLERTFSMGYRALTFPKKRDQK